jgi:mannosyl-3-phosphoglycerate phosphatase
VTRRPLAIITDLDGCLLDARTYDLGPVRTTLGRLRHAAIPLALCTSKTRVEVSHLFAALGGRYVAVVEDGGGLLLPPGVAPRATVTRARRTRHGRLVPLSAPYAMIRRVFAALRRRRGRAVVGFGDLDVATIARLTGLPLAAAGRAARREFDEPFVITHDPHRVLTLVRRDAARDGLTVTSGGRFHHLHGDTDKGRATRLVRRIMEQDRGAVTLVALGDSLLDAPMLAAADIPIIVPRPDGHADAGLRRRVPSARVAPAPGPTGWAAAVRRVLDGR